MEYSEKLQLLKSYHFPKQIEKLLMPQLNENVYGLCAAFLGERGTNKRQTIQDITEFLFKIGKLESKNINNLTLAEADLEFFDHYMYSLIKLEDGVLHDKNYYKDAYFDAKHRKAIIHKYEQEFDKSKKDFTYKLKDGKPIKFREFLNIDKESRLSYDSGIEILVSQYRNKYIIINCNEDEFKKFLNEDSRLSFIFSDIVTFRNLTNLEINAIIKENLIDKNIDESKLKNWVSENRYNIPFENREFALYVSNYMNFHNNELPKAVMRTDSSQKALETIIGLDSIKEQIEDLKSYLHFKHKAEKEDIKLPNQSLHMLFLGNAGSGKTTVARIVAQILYEIGICKENKLIEVSKKDLIAEYLGQTAPKTQAVIDKAMNGVLFIDEAYSLYQNQNDSYGSECIATLIKAMEDNKDKLVVIFAGYSDEMYTFVDSNPGIASRIGYTFEFKDYSCDELMQIYEKKLSKFNLSDGHKERVKELINYYHSLKNAGNGRLIDKIIQNVLIKHSKNNKHLTNLTEESVPSIPEMGDIIYTNGNKFVFPEFLEENDYKKTAFHEIGHAFIAYTLKHDSGIDKITIVPEASGALGYVRYKDEPAKFHQTKQDYLDNICRVLAGRAAEEVFLGKNNISGGCSSDIDKATTYCLSLARIGLSDTFGLMKPTSFLNKDEIVIEMKDEIKNILSSEYGRAIDILTKNKTIIEKIVKTLLSKKTLTGNELNELINGLIKNH